MSEINSFDEPWPEKEFRYAAWMDLSLPIKRHRENDHMHSKKFLDGMLRWSRCVNEDDPLHMSDMKYIYRFIECLFYVNPCEWNADVPFRFDFKIACSELIGVYLNHRMHYIVPLRAFTEENRRCFESLMELARFLASNPPPTGGGSMNDRSIARGRSRDDGIDI